MHLRLTVLALGALALAPAEGVRGEEKPPAPPAIFLRVRVSEPKAGRLKITLGGQRHAPDAITKSWSLPSLRIESDAGTWSDWIDLSGWRWHDRAPASGGLAEWPAMKIVVARAEGKEPIAGCAVEVQLADAPKESAVVHSFIERGGADAIGFLVPHPLRAHQDELETDSQMVARQLRWAKEAAGPKPIRLRRYDETSWLAGTPDPVLARRSAEALATLGINVVANAPPEVVRSLGMRGLGVGPNYAADPDEAERMWREFDDRFLRVQAKSSDGEWIQRTSPRVILSDELVGVYFARTEAAKRDGWFREYLRAHGVGDGELPTPVASAELPVDALQKPFSRTADLRTRRLLYHAGRFWQWWSARRLREGADRTRSTFPTATVESYPASHGFFEAWGPPIVGMSPQSLDYFEVAAQSSVDTFSAEDWLGLNHMYGPGYTWTGAQSYEYLGAVLRSAVGEGPMRTGAVITPSDDRYLRLKAYSSLGQGARSFAFWAFGPTYLSTENYWSDLRSEYDGIAHFHRALAAAESITADARPVRDPVGIVYSLSQDRWYSDQPAAFVEQRLLWHALRHLGVQPDFLDENRLDADVLARYRAVYLTAYCLDRRAGAALDAWVRGGGILYLSAGAATCDELAEPWQPPFAARAWSDGAAARLALTAGHGFAERGDLATAPALASVSVALGAPFQLPALGARLDVAAPEAPAFATFSDGKRAGAVIEHGAGKLVVVGFLPMLAYGRMADFKPTTLEEKWPEAPRRIVALALDAAGVKTVARPSVPVVEASLLDGPAGAAVVLANYTYQPVKQLSIDLRLPWLPARATSTEGTRVRMKKIEGGVRLTLPLEWTDIVLLPAPPKMGTARFR